MIIYYTDKIENKELAYCLYLDTTTDLEYWCDLATGNLHMSYEAGEQLNPVFFTEGNYTLEVITDE